MLLARSQRLEEALADLDRILRVEPENPVTLYNRGLIYRQLGRDAEAGRDLRAGCNAGFGPACEAQAEGARQAGMRGKGEKARFPGI